jgi:hypothetical protein
LNKSVDEILRNRKFSPVEKLLDLYEELEEDGEYIREQIDANPELGAVINTVDNQKLRERVLSSVMKCKQTEDGLRIKLAQLDAANPNRDSGPVQGIIMNHVERTLPDGRVVIEKVAQIATDKNQS